jgi:release factor glutamine methyltransferase
MDKKNWTIKQLLDAAADYLKGRRIDSPRLTAEILLARQLDLDRVSLYLDLERPLKENEVSGYRELVRRRAAHEPVQYITGNQEFWSLTFHVDPRVLIPRPESELLVEQAVQKARMLKKETPRILDMGTGSGVLAVCLAKELPEARLWATDAEVGILDVAYLNAKAHEVDQRIVFLRGDLWEPLDKLDVAFDIIVTNPPYVAKEEYQDLAPEIRDYEPRKALDGGKGGMHYIEKIISGAPNYLAPGGWLLVEIDPRQTQKAIQIMRRFGYTEFHGEKDYTHRFRMVAGRST